MLGFFVESISLISFPNSFERIKDMSPDRDGLSQIKHMWLDIGEKVVPQPIITEGVAIIGFRQLGP